MKKLGLFAISFMSVSLLASCGGNPSPEPTKDTYDIAFEGEFCTINGDFNFSDAVIKDKENAKYTIVPSDGYNLPETIGMPEGILINMIRILVLLILIKLLRILKKLPQPQFLMKVIVHSILRAQTVVSAALKTLMIRLKKAEKILNTQFLLILDINYQPKLSRKAKLIMITQPVLSLSVR
ncbi:MAG: hypothetical protein MJ206_03740 [Bacilli bacterium]|nr:hypothetical protein [Bacilli bacterium]